MSSRKKIVGYMRYYLLLNRALMLIYVSRSHNVSLKAKQLVEYAGKFVVDEPDDKEYTLRVKGGFIDGDRNPTSSACLGS